MFYFADGTYFSFVVLMERYIFRNIYMSGCCVPDEKKPWILVLHNLHSIRSYCNYVVDIILDTPREYSSQVLEFFLQYSRQVLESFIVLQLGIRLFLQYSRQVLESLIVLQLGAGVLLSTPARYWSPIVPQLGIGVLYSTPARYWSSKQYYNQALETFIILPLGTGVLYSTPARYWSPIVLHLGIGVLYSTPTRY